MAKNMGEFEERPAVKEATPVPLQRRKPTGWIVATVVFALIAIGAIGYIIFDKTQTKKDELAPAYSDGDESEEKPAGDPDGSNESSETGLREKEDYDGIINESLAVLKDKLSKDDAIVIDSDELKGAYIKVDDGIYTTLDYGRSVGVVKYYDGLIDERGGDLGDRIADVLIKHDFKRDSSIKRIAVYTDGKGSICQFMDYLPALVCGHETWISSENKELVRQLGVAYQKKVKLSDGSQDLLPAKTSEVVRSSVPEYERIGVSASALESGFGAVMLFYKKDGEEWKFFRSAQAGISCEEYTGDIAKAFAGTNCVDYTTGKNKKVGE